VYRKPALSASLYGQRGRTAVTKAIIAQIDALGEIGDARRLSGGEGLEIRDVVVPSMGDGPEEVRIISYLKSPGDRVEWNEALYCMETDKAAPEVECSIAGTLLEWLAPVGAVLPVGAPVARIAVDPDFDTSDFDRVAAATPSSRSESAKGKAARRAKLPASDDKARRESAGAEFVEREIGAEHRTLVMRLKRSQQLVVPSVVKRSIDWSMVQRVADARKMFGDLSPSAFQTFAYAAARATASHPKLRSTMPSDDTIREYSHVNLGIAVGTPSGQLNVAVVPNADALGYDEFVRTAQKNILAARAGHDQASDSVQFLLTYMGGYEIEDGIPVLVAPAVAVLFIGSTFTMDGAQRVRLSLTFDHRLIQGVEAAEFMKTVAHMSEDGQTWRSNSSC
jgi:pyruvate/2-oxoglutarate dehydrogenase complex dihydrolipoamide acyltransferase (E2) component